MQAAIAPPAIPVGKIKSFGPFGPKYEVGQALRQLDDGDWILDRWDLGQLTEQAVKLWMEGEF